MTEQFVGRASELRQLDATLVASAEGRGALVVVSGEAGVGKSRFCDELSARSRRRGFTAVTGRCWVDGGAPPFWPWQPILSELCGDVASAILAPENGQADATRDRFARFEAVVHYLADACARTPVCVVIDDINAADTGTVLLARFVAQALPRLGLSLVLSRRTGEPARNHDSARLLDDIEAEATPIVLRPFDLVETAAFLAANGLDRLDDSLTKPLHRATAGIPLFLRRVVALGTPSPDADALSAGVQAAIDMALTRLSPKARGILQTSAILGPKPSVTAAAQVAGTEPGAVLDAVDEGAVAGLLVAESTNRFAFSHELIRSAFEDGLGGAERLDAHAAAAAVVGVDGAVPAAMLARRAHHALAAAPRSPEDSRRAVAACERAAEAMTCSLAYEQADGLLSSAVDLYEQTPTDPPPGRLLVRWAQVALQCGRMDDARKRFELAATATRSENNPILFAEAALGLGGHGVKEHRLTSERARVLSLQRAALDGLPEDAVSLRCRLQAKLAAEAVVDGESLDPVLAAVEATRRCGDPDALAEALALWHHVVLTPEHTRSRLAIAEELIQVAANAGHGVLGLTGAWFRAIDLLHLGDQRAGSALEDARARASTLESRNTLANIAVVDAMLLIRAGRLDEAAGAAERARDLGEAAGEVNALNYYSAQILGIRWFEGRSAEVAELAQQAAALPAVVDSDFAFLASAAAFHAQAGRVGRARAMVTELVRGDPAELPQSSSWLVGMAAIADVAAATDDAQLARRVYDLLAPYTDLPTLGGFAVLCLGSTERALGVAAQTFGDLDHAVGHFERAIEEDRRLGHVPMAIIAHADLAFALARRGRDTDRARAAPLLERAITEAARIGMAARAASWQEARAALLAASDDGARVGHAARRGTIHRDGKRWVVALHDRRVRVPNLVGMRYLAELLARPGQSIPALTLASHGTAARSPTRHELLDDEARNAYAARAQELANELTEAEANNDIIRAERLRSERDALVDELEKATGLGGRSRAFTDPGERARSSVSKAIKRAIHAIDNANPSIAGALRDTVHCGLVCSYLPDTKAPITWATHPGGQHDSGRTDSLLPR
jgi:tetratricopeptide (TPR) repeat protein